jgi:hypothetical protein
MRRHRTAFTLLLSVAAGVAVAGCGGSSVNSGGASNTSATHNAPGGTSNTVAQRSANNPSFRHEIESAIKLEGEHNGHAVSELQCAPHGESTLRCQARVGGSSRPEAFPVKINTQTGAYEAELSAFTVTYEP